MEGMSATAYEEIVARLDGMDAAPMRMPMDELRMRMVPLRKRTIEEFLVPSGKSPGTGEDPFGAMRAEWDDRG